MPQRAVFGFNTHRTKHRAEFFHLIAQKIFDYLMSNASGNEFEALAKAIFHVEYGEEFVPLGGMHDGGADAVLIPHIFEGNKPNTFFQFSVTEEGKTATKIGDTIAALRKAERDPKQLVYSTSQRLPKHDVLQADAFEKYGVLVLIRDAERLLAKINDSDKASRVFKEYFANDISALVNEAKTLTGPVNRFVDDPTVFAFLDLELKDRFTKDALHLRILDALIYWALRDTDPDQQKWLRFQEISDAIVQVFPNARGQLLPHLMGRLEDLSTKELGQERIRHHKKDGLYCLPFEMRSRLAAQAVEEVNLQQQFLDSIRRRLVESNRDWMTEELTALATDLVFQTVHEYFVEQGMILAAFLSKKVETFNISDQIVEDQISKAISQSKVKQKISPDLIAECMKTLRAVFYRNNEVEQKYLHYLSRTSMLFMTLQAAPRLIEYFNQMGGNFRLLVGTDLLVKAISEQYLPEHHRQVESLLKIVAEMGGRLVLTEPVLKELLTHLHAVDLEYRNHYLPNEAYMTQDEISECNRILIRSYYYGRAVEGGPRSWQQFINSLLNPADLRDKNSPRAAEQLRGLVIQRFKMEYLSSEELSEGVNQAAILALAEQLANARGAKHAVLSANDALMVHAVYALRRKAKEHASYDGFGYRTWWLTKESHILSLTGEVVLKEGTPYMMRPEFLLNYIALAPKAADVRRAFGRLLPSSVGLQLGKHLPGETMEHLLAGVKEWAELPHERISMLLAEKINKLKYDRLKRYVQNVA